MSKAPELSLNRIGGRGLFRATLLFSLFSNLLTLTGPLFMLQVYDRVLGSRSEETLVALTVLVAALFGFYGLLEYARGRVMARVGARFQLALGPRVFNAVLDAAAHRRGAGTGAAALQDLEAIREFFSAPVLLAIFDMPWTPVFLVAIFLFHPLLGWMAVIGGGVIILAAAANQILTRRRIADARSRALQAADFARQAEGGSELVWAQGMGPQMARRWQQMQDEALVRAVRANDLTGAFSAFSRAFRFLLQSAMLALGAWLVLRNEMTAGAMIAGSILLGRALAPVELALAQWPVAQRARTAWKQLAQLLEEVPAREPPMPLPRPEARIEARGVSVIRQRGDRPLLHDISLAVPPGEALGVIGKSGAGKTTLARVLVGLVTPVSGEVRLGGALLEQYGPERLGRLVGYLPQDVQLFDGTVAENIARMAPQPDPDQVVAAARKARVHEVILNLPDGYDTRLGAGDALLSGGQKQRLALARALYGAPQVLVLDEPNSALDADGSEALSAAVTEVKQAGGSVIIMTHRPTAITACDRLLVLDGGRAVAQGPRDEVIRAMLKNAEAVRRAAGGAAHS